MITRRTALTSTLAFGLAFIGKGASAQGAVTWKYGHGGQVQHPSHIVSVEVAKRVKERSNGRFTIEVFPDRQLGEEKDLLEGVQLGSVDMSYLSTGPLGNVVPEINVLDIPFIFRDRQHAYRVFDGPIGRELLDKFSPKGMYAAAIWENGWRHLTSKKPIQSVEDMKGLKLRTMANEVHINAFKTLGAGAIPMAWGEVYTSLEQGVIDAQENPITAIAANSLWEVQKVLTLTGHVYGPHVVLLSSRSLAKLDPALQTILKDAIREVTPLQRELSDKLEGEALATLKANGMAVNEIDKAAIQAKVAGLAPSYEKKFGKELLDRIRQAAAPTN